MRIIRNVLAAVLAGVFVATPIAIAAHPSEHRDSISTPVVAAQVRSAPLVASRSHVRAPIDDMATLRRAERVLEVRRARAAAVAREKRRLERIYSSSAAWANQPFSIAVANCESGPGPHGAWVGHYIGNLHLVDPNGHDGKWQFAPSTARSVGAPGASIAYLPEAAQDYFAWKLWKRDGWAPWECAHLV